jgi:PhzF family phenazine biosynthesis protein
MTHLLSCTIMSQRIVQVDAFTDTPFAGNPAAVCVLPAPRDDVWMQNVAREMNLSETAFLVRRDDGGYDLRWFTLAVEVDLCGHATIASAHVLWQDGHLPPDQQARFHTKSGLLTARRDGDWIELDFPATPPQPAEPPTEVLRALGVPPAFSGKTRFDYFLELDSEATVRALAPDFGLLKRADVRGVIVTAPASLDGFDYVCRFFAPSAGIDEDPVTGSAQCALGPYWQATLGKDELLGYQASARGGIVRVRPRGDRVLIAGQAVTTLTGELLAEGPATTSFRAQRGI